MVGGEAFPPDLARTLRDLVQGRVTNMYGPTETTIWSSTWDIGAFDGSVPIGRPIANTSMYILDDALRPVPIGVAGDLWIGGDGVTKGYLHRPELTAERFIDNPFDAGMMYKTGDVARFDEDGRLRFLGRRDHQVKIRGHRIELGEIEAVLEAMEEVHVAIVTVRGDREDHRLVAYVVPSGADLDIDGLKDRLQETLPAVMVPAMFVSMESIPLTPNGKVNRGALPDPPNVSQAPEPVDRPQGDVERLICDIWKRALQTPSIGVTDNFFDLGGHSLLAVRITRELGERLRREIPIVVLFQYPTIRSLAAHIADEPRPNRASSGVERGLSRAEERRRALQRSKR